MRVADNVPPPAVPSICVGMMIGCAWLPPSSAAGGPCCGWSSLQMSSSPSPSPSAAMLGSFCRMYCRGQPHGDSQGNGAIVVLSYWQ